MHVCGSLPGNIGAAVRPLRATPKCIHCARLNTRIFRGFPQIRVAGPRPGIDRSESTRCIASTSLSIIVVAFCTVAYPTRR